MSELLILQNTSSLGKKCLTSLIFGLEFAALFLLLGNGGNIKWLPPTLIFSIVGIGVLFSFLFPFIWRYLEAKNRIDSDKIYAFFYSAIRCCIAFNMASFGWKKFYGLQFIVPSEISNLPMNQQTGEWLTWFYFGYSHQYGIVIALIQIIGACLLLFKRTMLIGAVLLFSFLLNLTMINIFYQMNAGALMQSVLLTLGIGFLVALDYKKIIDFFLKSTPSLLTVNFNNLMIKNAIRFSIILLSLLFTIYLKTLIK